MHLMLAGYVEDAVQQATAFGAGDRHVEVAVFDDRVLGQQRIAVVAVGIDRIAAVGKVAPHTVGEEFVLRGLRPARVARGVAVVAAKHFLEEDDVGLGAAHRLAQFRQDEAPVEGGEALMGVHRQYPQPLHGRGLVDAGETITAGFVAHNSSSIAGACVSPVPALSPASQLPQVLHRLMACTIPVGAGLPAIGPVQPTSTQTG